jgi:hypothetical protein
MYAASHGSAAYAMVWVLSIRDNYKYRGRLSYPEGCVAMWRRMKRTAARTDPTAFPNRTLPQPPR